MILFVEFCFIQVGRTCFDSTLENCFTAEHRSNASVSLPIAICNGEKEKKTGFPHLELVL